MVLTKDNLRTAIAFIGGFMVASGNLSMDDLTALMDHIKSIGGALATLGAFGWGLMDKPATPVAPETETPDVHEGA